MNTPTTPAPPVRLIIVDDDPLVRAGLALMLGGADGVDIVGEGADGSEVAALVDRLRPDVARARQRSNRPSARSGSIPDIASPAA